MTREAHDFDAFCKAWISIWLAMEQTAMTSTERAWYRYEVECWSKVRTRGLQAINTDINRALRRAGYG